jgi:thioredoxin 1
MADKPFEVDASSFDTQVVNSDVPVLVDFWAPWCGPCRMIAPIVDELAEEYNGRVRFAKVNTDESGAVAARLGIRSIPTLIIFKGGQEAGRVVGYTSKDDLKKRLESAIGS